MESAPGLTRLSLTGFYGQNKQEEVQCCGKAGRGQGETEYGIMEAGDERRETGEHGLLFHQKKEQEQSLETICLQPHNKTVMSGFQGHDNEQLQ